MYYPQEIEFNMQNKNNLYIVTRCVLNQHMSGCIPAGTKGRALFVFLNDPRTH